MKLSKEELIQKINDSEIADEIKISLMEDVTDSFEVAEVDNSELEEVKAKYEELKEKYKARFLNAIEETAEEVAEEIEEEDEEDLKYEDLFDEKGEIK